LEGVGGLSNGKNEGDALQVKVDGSGSVGTEGLSNVRVEGGLVTVDAGSGVYVFEYPYSL
jgi:hypothetical protein